MDFRTLEYFTTVAQELNFTKAAERLNMSQPPLSSAIKSMEDDLGVQLFIRGKRRLTLTPAGELLYKRSEQILSISEQTRDELFSMTHELSGVLKIGTVTGLAPYLISDWIADFRNDYPYVTYRLHTGSSDEIFEGIRHGTLDIGVIAAPYDSEHYHGILVGEEPWVAILPAEHPLAKRKEDTVKLCELVNEPLLVPSRRSRIEAIRRWFGSIRQEPRIVCEMAAYLDAIALVERGIGICIFPKTTDAPNPKVRVLKITDPPKIAQYLLVWPKNGHLPEMAQIFVDSVSDRMRKSPQIKEAESFSDDSDSPTLL